MFSIFSPVTFGAQRKITHQMARSISVSKIDWWNVGGICGNVRYNTHLYCLAVQAGFYSDTVECLTATQEIPVGSSAGAKGV